MCVWLCVEAVCEALCGLSLVWSRSGPFVLLFKINFSFFSFTSRNASLIADSGACVGNDILSTSTLRRKLFAHLSEEEDDDEGHHSGGVKPKTNTDQLTVGGGHIKVGAGMNEECGKVLCMSYDFR